MAGLNPEILQDPSFEYLNGRDELTRLNAEEARHIQDLLRGSEKRPRVGINLRPIRHLWSPKSKAYSRTVEEQFLDRLAEGLIKYAETSKRPPCYVFFPMNPQEFGCSDLRVAYHLHRRVGSKVDLRVWEDDPNVDGVLHLLRQMHAVIAMRFSCLCFLLDTESADTGY